MNEDIFTKYLVRNYSQYVFLLNASHKIDFHPIIQKSLQINQLDRCEKFVISNKEKKVTIQNLREMIGFIHKTSFYQGYKIIIFEEIEKTDPISLNILLKLLEELSSKVIFFITTNNIYSLPQTLRSRSLPILIKTNKSEELHNEIDLFAAREFISEDDWPKITEAIYKFFFNLFLNSHRLNSNDIKYYLELLDDLEKKINEARIFHYDKKTILYYFLNSVTIGKL